MKHVPHIHGKKVKFIVTPETTPIYNSEVPFLCKAIPLQIKVCRSHDACHISHCHVKALMKVRT